MSEDEPTVRVVITWTYTTKVPLSYLNDEQMEDIAMEAFIRGDGEAKWQVEP